MSELVEFDDLNQLKVLLRAGVELKFHISNGSDVINGSSVYAAALGNVREALIEGLRYNSMVGKAQAEAEWYRLGGDPRVFGIIARRASLHPRWRELDEFELRDWIEALASPFVVGDEVFEAIRMEVEKMLESNDG